MNLTYFGHSCFLLETPAVRLVLDPYLRENPHGSVDPATVPCDFVLCSHAHDDHIADALNLSRLHGATLVAPYELANYFSQQGAKVLDLMPGGGLTLPWGRLQMTPAVHSSALELPNGETRAMGVAAGYVIRAENRSLYHAGDTALFSDMQLIARGGLDLALLPIGDFYTMGPDDAVEAVKLLRPRLTVPMHYNSNDRIKTDPHAFATAVTQAGYAARVLKAGERITL
jgi:L-ascorbate metabolism protein UlaG (beta-lactamase superfamily)